MQSFRIKRLYELLVRGNSVSAIGSFFYHNAQFWHTNNRVEGWQDKHIPVARLSLYISSGVGKIKGISANITQVMPCSYVSLVSHVAFKSFTVAFCS